VLQEGNRVSQAHVHRAPGESTTFADLVSEGPILVLFYLFDWSST
jgi:hypothetical protein